MLEKNLSSSLTSKLESAKQERLSFKMERTLYAKNALKDFICSKSHLLELQSSASLVLREKLDAKEEMKLDQI